MKLQPPGPVVVPKNYIELRKTLKEMTPKTYQDWEATTKGGGGADENEFVNMLRGGAVFFVWEKAQKRTSVNGNIESHLERLPLLDPPTIGRFTEWASELQSLIKTEDDKMKFVCAVPLIKHCPVLDWVCGLALMVQLKN